MHIPLTGRPHGRLLPCVVAVLMLGAVLPAFAEAGGQIFTTDAYTVVIPAGWQMDITTLEGDDDFVDLGYFWSEEETGGLVLEAGLYRYPALTGVSLTAGDDSFVSNWANAMIVDFEGSKPQLREFISTDELVFVVLDIEDELEPYCYAETLSDGTIYMFHFYAYRMMDDDGDVPDATLIAAEYDVFRQILFSFRLRR